MPDNRVYVRDPEAHFFNGIDEETKTSMKLESHSWGPFVTEATHAAWREIPSTYLICKNDQSIPAFAQ
jgi:hypothetical protein